MFQEDPDMGCKDIVVKMSKTQMTIIKKCTKEMKFTSPADQKERAAVSWQFPIICYVIMVNCYINF